MSTNNVIARLFARATTGDWAPVGSSAGDVALPVNLAASGAGLLPSASSTLTAAGASTLSGTTSTAGSAVLDVSSAGNVSFHLLTAAFVGTVVFEQSFDPAGTNGTWAPVPCVPEDAQAAPMNALVLSTASAYIRQFTQGMFGPALFRVRVSAYTSGTLAVLLKGGPGWYEPQPSLTPSNAVIGAVRPAPAPTGVSTAVTAPSGASGTALAANAARMGATLYNVSGATVNINLGTTAGAAAGTYTWPCPVGGYYEVPFGYTGAISVYGVGGTASLSVTEVS